MRKTLRNDTDYEMSCCKKIHSHSYLKLLLTFCEKRITAIEIQASLATFDQNGRINGMYRKSFSCFFLLILAFWNVNVLHETQRKAIEH